MTKTGSFSLPTKKKEICLLVLTGLINTQNNGKITGTWYMEWFSYTALLLHLNTLYNISHPLSHTCIHRSTFLCNCFLSNAHTLMVKMLNCRFAQVGAISKQCQFHDDHFKQLHVRTCHLDVLPLCQGLEKDEKRKVTGNPENPKMQWSRHCWNTSITSITDHSEACFVPCISPWHKVDGILKVKKECLQILQLNR